MSLIDALKAGNYQYQSNSNSNSKVSIKTGNGNNNIRVNGGNVDITTGNGNQNLFVNAANNLNIQTGSIGTDMIDASAFSANIATNGSDDTIKFIGNSFNIADLGGNNTILAKSTGNDDKKNTITVGNGNDQIFANANNLKINDSDGNLTSFVYGDNVDLKSGNGSHTVGFWGNNVNMNFGNGNNTIQTLDFTIANANANTLGVLDNIGAIDALEAKVTSSSKVVGEAIKDTTFNYKEAVAKKYNLNTKEKEILDKIDLNQKFTDGKPLYVLVKSPKKSAAAGQDVYVIAKRDGTTHTWAESDHECIATDSWKSQMINGSNSTTKEVTTETTYLLNGISNANIKAGNGDNNIALTADVKGNSGNNIELGDSNNGNNIIIRNGFTTKATDTKTTTTTTDKSFEIYEYGQKTWNSPLVVDFDKDGKVEATAAMGVDIDNNGVADGAATGGDKMLAMSNFNGNKNIDGQEVFGDQTVSPFSGKKINAANGFEALKVIAEQAKQYTGIDCIKNGSVDLQALKMALATIGVNLGFIGDNNTTTLEDLGHVASINVQNYSEADATGDVQHKQLGSYTDTDGGSQKVDDVWFTAQKAENKPSFLEILKKIK